MSYFQNCSILKNNSSKFNGFPQWIRAVSQYIMKYNLYQNVSPPTKHMLYLIITICVECICKLQKKHIVYIPF